MAKVTPITDILGNQVFTRSGTVFTGTPNREVHGDAYLSENLFNDTGMSLQAYNQKILEEKKRKQREAAERRRKELMAQQKAEEQGLVNKFTSTIEGQEALPAMAQRISSELGIPQTREVFLGLNEAVADLEQSLNTLPERVEGETRGFDVNANQLARIKESRRQPIVSDLSQTASNLNKAGTRFTTLQDALGQRLGLNLQQQQKELKPIQLEAELLSDRLAREFTGFTQERQNQFDMLMDQIRGGRELTLAQMQQASRLAEMEQQFENQKELVKLQSDLGVDTSIEETRRLLPFQKEMERFKTDEAIRAALETRTGSSANNTAPGGTDWDSFFDSAW